MALFLAVTLVAVQYAIIALLAVLIHEAAHIYAATVLGIRVKRIGITWRGPFIVREQGTPLASACTALAGPLSNLVLSVLFWNVAPTFAQVNLVLGVFNLIPMQGTDGSHALLALQRTREMAALQIRPGNR